MAQIFHNPDKATGTAKTSLFSKQYQNKAGNDAQKKIYHATINVFKEMNFSV